MDLQIFQFWTPRSDKVRRVRLRENEFLSKTILACLLEAQMALIHEIKNGEKYRDTAPLKSFLGQYEVRIFMLRSVVFEPRTAGSSAVCNATKGQISQKT